MTKKHFNRLAAAVRDWRRVCPSVDAPDVAQKALHAARAAIAKAEGSAP